MPYCPITFFSPEEPYHAITQKKCSSPKETTQYNDFKPIFCDASLPDFPVAFTQVPPSVPLTPHSPTAHFPFQDSLPLRSQCPPPQQPPQPKKEGRVSAPKAYDVAMELMAQLPLRMVDNALYAYDGQIYRFVTVSVMNRIIMHHCRQYVQAVGDASIIERIYKVIQAEPRIVFKPDPNAHLLVADQDGLIDLETLTCYPHSAAPFVTSLLRGSFLSGQTETCPVFDRFLIDITGGDPLLIARIWEAIGYALTPDTGGKCFLLLQGVSDSGKSLLGDIISSLIDEENVTSLDLGALGERFGTSELVGKQLCLSLDMPSGVLDTAATSTFKSLTGGDIITADVKYQARIKFRCQATFLLATNHALLTRDHDPALLGRAVTIPFRYAISRDRQDHNLRAKILTERNAIICRALLAYRQLRRNNYCFSGNFAPNEVTGSSCAPENNLTDALWAFLKDHCISVPGNFVTTTELYSAFCTHLGVSWPGGLGKFSSAANILLDDLFPLEIKRDRRRPGGGRNPERGFVGIALQSDALTENTGDTKQENI